MVDVDKIENKIKDLLKSVEKVKIIRYVQRSRITEHNEYFDPEISFYIDTNLGLMRVEFPVDLPLDFWS